LLLQLLSEHLLLLLLKTQFLLGLEEHALVNRGLLLELRKHLVGVSELLLHLLLVTVIGPCRHQLKLLDIPGWNIESGVRESLMRHLVHHLLLLLVLE
jgi:hypothetical protein